MNNGTRGEWRNLTPFHFPHFCHPGGGHPLLKMWACRGRWRKLTSSTLTRRSCPFMSKCGVTCHQMWRKNPNGAASAEKCVSMNCNLRSAGKYLILEYSFSLPPLSVPRKRPKRRSLASFTNVQKFLTDRNMLLTTNYELA